MSSREIINDIQTPRTRRRAATGFTTARRRRQRSRRWPWLLLVALTGLLGLLWLEVETSWLQSTRLPPVARQLHFELAPGAGEAVHYPAHGPFDQRLGYTRLPQWLPLLEAAGFEVEARARFSEALLAYAAAGLNPPYREKTRAGLDILDPEGLPLYQYRYPRRAFTSFEEIAPLMVEALLFIEDRHLLDPDRNRMNPAVNWWRFVKAAVFQLGDVMHLDMPSMGGSTLATQIEKFRHSRNGITGSIDEKLRQIVSASLRVYREGPDTMAVRQRLVLDYLNTVPLAASPGFGEVNGIGDGLHAWFGSDLREVNARLQQTPADADGLQQQGLALRQVIALMISHRRPSYYLLGGRAELAALTDAHLRLLARKGVISQVLLAAAAGHPLPFRQGGATAVSLPDKGASMVRSRLASLLQVSPYELDRLDLSAVTTLQQSLQVPVTDFLRRLREPGEAERLGLLGDSLLRPGQEAQVSYSFTLFERSARGQLVRVQTDNTDLALDLNAGSKLELGSTAKLRVLTSYLEIIAELHREFSVPGALPAPAAEERDPLTRWVAAQLAAQPDISLQALLSAALERRYSASPREVFFTGGGEHRFNNFRRADDGRTPTLLEALRESLNLPFVRLLRDVISYISHRQWQPLKAVLSDDADPRRREVLERFIDRESEQYLNRFWRKYQHLPPAERLDSFLAGLSLTPVRAAVIHRYLYPTASLEDFADFLRTRPLEVSSKDTESLYRRYAPGNYSLPDTGYLARVHPLELWLLGYLLQQEAPTLRGALEASAEPRREVYGWLLRSRVKSARDTRIRSMLEVQAFAELHRRWQRLGYPFAYLVPSLATALGSSGDRPAALAELMGIIVNDGLRSTTQRVTGLTFGAGTPYEVQLSRGASTAEQVMPAAVAAALRGALAEVVNDGTARRLRGVFHDASGAPLAVGGKTGTGDNRLVIGGARKSAARALSRTATLVFYLGERHYGTLTAFVTGDTASEFRFTSALPAQVLRGMAPLLAPYLAAAAPGGGAGSPGMDAAGGDSVSLAHPGEAR